MEKAGLMQEVEVDGDLIPETMYTPYSLRHFFASMLIAQNKDLKTIQERMGHEDAAMTLNVYGHDPTQAGRRNIGADRHSFERTCRVMWQVCGE